MIRATTNFEPLERRLLMARPDPSPAENVLFRLPLSSDTSVHFYYDRDDTSAVRAWNNTTQSYNGHTGSDFSGGPRGRPIYAAADGILIGRDDGWLDQEGPPNGNYIRINHGNNRNGSPIVTVYLHMNAGTPINVPMGTLITAGQQIGGVGTSGNSTGLHLHFHTSLAGEAFDPFKATGSTETSWWVNQGSGSPGTTAQPKKLLVGDTAEVYETTSLNVRSPNPTSSAIATRSSGMTGTVLEGPVYAAFDATNLTNTTWVWYRIQWSDGVTGWSAQNWLRKLVDSIAPTVQSSEFLFETSPHKLDVQFSENVGASLSAADFSLTNLTTNQPVPFTFAYNAATSKATIGYAGVLPDANYRLRTIAAGITDSSGNVMQSDSVYDFAFLNGDATRNRSVNSADFNILATNFGTSGKTFSQGNFSYDANGDVNSADFNILASQFGKTLPGGGENARAAAGGANGFFGRTAGLGATAWSSNRLLGRGTPDTGDENDLFG